MCIDKSSRQMKFTSGLEGVGSKLVVLGALDYRNNGAIACFRRDAAGKKTNKNKK